MYVYICCFFEFKSHLECSPLFIWFPFEVIDLLRIMQVLNLQSCLVICMKDVTIERKASLAAKAPSSDLAENPSVVFDPTPQTTDKGRDQTEIERGVANLPSSEVTLLSGVQGADGQGTIVLNSADSDELNRQQQAATKVQAAFRGYLVIFYGIEYCNSCNKLFVKNMIKLIHFFFLCI